MLLDLIPVFHHLSPAYSQPASQPPQQVVTWQTLIDEYSLVENLPTYCKVISEVQSRCGDNFLAINENIDLGIPSIIARKVAATCLEKISLENVDALAHMFNADLKDMSRLASGSPGTSKPPGIGWGLYYSPKAGNRAYDRAYTARIKELGAIRRLQVITGQGRPFITAFESVGDRSAIIGEIKLEISMGQDAGRAAHNDPASVGEPPNVVRPTTPPPEPEPKKPEPPVHVPQITPSPPSVFDAICDVEVEPDDVVVTPMLKNDVLIENMLRCQEDQERKLTNITGSTDRDPNTPMNKNAMDWAMHNLAVGFCNTETLGREFCKEWKQKQIIVPLNPDLKDVTATRQPSCPANLISESDCHKAQQEILERCTTTDVAADAIMIIFQPRAEIPYFLSLISN